jgi:DNA-binding transcriptional ArsR family regulator
MASADLLSKIRGELDARLRELRPLLSEYERLLVAADALASTERTPPRARPRRVARTAPASAPISTIAPVQHAASSPALPRAAVSRRPPAPRRPAVSRGPASRSAGAPKRAQRGVAARAILAALEHGSHTASELLLVTAMSGPTIRNNLRRLQQAGTITPIKRDGDGRAAYALASTPS